METCFAWFVVLGLIFVPLNLGLRAVRRQECLINGNRYKVTGEIAVIAGHIILLGVGIYIIGLGLTLLTKSGWFFLIGLFLQFILLYISSEFASGRVRRRDPAYVAGITMIDYAWRDRFSRWGKVVSKRKDTPPDA